MQIVYDSSNSIRTKHFEEMNKRQKIIFDRVREQLKEAAKIAAKLKR